MMAFRSAWKNTTLHVHITNMELKIMPTVYTQIFSHKTILTWTLTNMLWLQVGLVKSGKPYVMFGDGQICRVRSASHVQTHIRPLVAYSYLTRQNSARMTHACSNLILYTGCFVTRGLVSLWIDFDTAYVLVMYVHAHMGISSISFGRPTQSAKLIWLRWWLTALSWRYACIRNKLRAIANLHVHCVCAILPRHFPSTFVPLLSHTCMWHWQTSTITDM